MAQPWKIISSIPTVEGLLELRQRGERDFLITIGTQVLMNSLSNRSEVVLGKLGCAHLNFGSTSRVLIGGLGMGCTLGSVLDCLPSTAQVFVAELNPIVLEWCQGPLALLTSSAATDPRVRFMIGDVANIIGSFADSGGDHCFDAIIIDLYRGPHAKTDVENDPFYGRRAILKSKAALKPGGVLAVWGENPDDGFIKRLQSAGFLVTTERPGRGGLRHVVFLAKKTS
ncbi:MAG TPA: spermidine synthase [Desulfuromonadales bacterium]|nr:spermidine synthase [Desulfuromonadales bacterium]